MFSTKHFQALADHLEQNPDVFGAIEYVGGFTLAGPRRGTVGIRLDSFADPKAVSAFLKSLTLKGDIAYSVGALAIDFTLYGNLNGSQMPVRVTCRRYNTRGHYNNFTGEGTATLAEIIDGLTREATAGTEVTE